MSLDKQKICEILKRSYQKGHLSHAYLLIGKQESESLFISHFLASIYLNTASNCLSKHPDFYQIEPLSKARKILIEQIRELERKLSSTSHHAYGKVGLIHDADRLVPQAASAFLKTLEEPPANSLIILVTQFPNLILDTIRSRTICFHIHEHENHKNKILLRDKKLLDGLNQFFNNYQKIRLGVAFELTQIILDLMAKFRLEKDSLMKEEESNQHVSPINEIDKKEKLEQVKSLIERDALNERNRLIEVIAEYFSLKILNISSANRFLMMALFRILELIDNLQQILEQNMQEKFAFEAIFLEIILVMNRCFNDQKKSSNEQ